MAALRGAALAILLFLAIPLAIAAGPERGEKIGGEIDPTKPVFFNIREEFYDLKGDDWRNFFILRSDIIKLGGLRNFLLRFDVPIVSADLGQGSQTGIGDIYSQLLLIPYASKKFFLAAGSGITAPSATESSLGTGKWQFDPLAIPGWWLGERRALFFIKVQDFISFAGQSDRDNVHYMTVNPFFIAKLSEKWWVGADTEAKFNWEQDNRKSYKSGVLLLRMWTDTFGTWIKPEIPWGPNREGDWTIKASCFWNY